MKILGEVVVECFYEIEGCAKKQALNALVGYLSGCSLMFVWNRSLDELEGVASVLLNTSGLPANPTGAVTFDVGNALLSQQVGRTALRPVANKC